MKKVTYIITHKESSIDRRRNLHLVLDWLNNINEIERVIIIEQGDIPRSSDITKLGININYTLDYKFLENTKTFFNKCWAYNHGAKMSNTEWLAFGDNDVVMDIDDMNESIDTCLKNACDTFSPYECVHDLSAKETEILVNNREFNSISPRLKTKKKNIRRGTPYGGGIMFIKKQSFFDIGAWDESFVNWGAEDDDISNRIIHNLKAETVSKSGFHLNHERTIHSTNKNEFYSENTRLYVSKRDKPLQDIIKDFDITQIGLEDKYTKG